MAAISLSNAKAGLKAILEGIAPSIGLVFDYIPDADDVDSFEAIYVDGNSTQTIWIVKVGRVEVPEWSSMPKSSYERNYPNAMILGGRLGQIGSSDLSSWEILVEGTVLAELNKEIYTELGLVGAETIRNGNWKIDDIAEAQTGDRMAFTAQLSARIENVEENAD